VVTAPRVLQHAQFLGCLVVGEVLLGPGGVHVQRSVAGGTLVLKQCILEHPVAVILWRDTRHWRCPSASVAMVCRGRCTANRVSRYSLSMTRNRGATSYFGSL
jgi:hypothetical protein